MTGLLGGTALAKGSRSASRTDCGSGDRLPRHRCKTTVILGEDCASRDHRSPTARHGPSILSDGAADRCKALASHILRQDRTYRHRWEPYPLGWIAIPIARFRRRFTNLVIESAFWRIPSSIPASPVARMRARLTEAINRALTRYCDISFFATQSYRDTLHVGPANTAHVLPSVWVDDDQLIPADRLAELAPAKGTAILFAGRLPDGKGLRVLLDAIMRSRVPVDIIGDGDLRDVVVQAQYTAPSLIRLLEPVDYGAAFSALLDRYAALVVPTISDEQPRIIFDAFARGIPVLASATSGNRQIVEQARTGLLYEPNDVAATAAALAAAVADPVRLRTMGETGLRDMAVRTHAAMHAVRARAIATALAGHRRSR